MYKNCSYNPYCCQMTREVKLINFKLTVNGCSWLPNKQQRKCPHLNPLIRICISRKFTDLHCVNRLFTQTFVSSEAKIPIVMLTSAVRIVKNWTGQQPMRARDFSGFWTGKK